MGSPETKTEWRENEKRDLRHQQIPANVMLYILGMMLVWMLLFALGVVLLLKSDTVQLLAPPPEPKKPPSDPEEVFVSGIAAIGHAIGKTVQRVVDSVPFVATLSGHLVFPRTFAIFYANFGFYIARILKVLPTVLRSFKWVGIVKSWKGAIETLANALRSMHRYAMEGREALIDSTSAWRYRNLKPKKRFTWSLWYTTRPADAAARPGMNYPV
mmetsp:Transcript_3205/g.12859  ORF Transcript_3205/g.12859 Transcript_3205/m.12859 type:complete len:214 (-) Transcript_3205:2104-2745(-)